MKISFLLLVLIGSATLTGCASGVLQYSSLRSEIGSLPESHVLKTVEFKDQTAGFCGPASLSMAMQAAGTDIEPALLAEQMITPGLHGTLQQDLIGAARRHGMLAVPIDNFKKLIQEVSAGTPVIIFENLGLDWYQQWHYAVVVGYDITQNEVIMHSGHSAYLHENMKVFENSWKLSDYWGLVVLAPGQLAASVGEREHAKAAVALETIGKVEESARVYKSILQKWPDSLVAAIGLSKYYFDNGKSGEATAILKKAQQFHPDSAAIQKNLAIVSQK